MENNLGAPEKNAKELKDEKQKDAKLEEQVLKSLNSCTTTDEKFNLLVKKYVDLEKGNKKLNAVQKQYEKRFDALLREKDNLQKEYSKGVLMRDKLEQVCREQQKLIKSVKNESLTKIREEEERRKLNQAKFEHSINEINLTMNRTSEENKKLKDDNIEMTKKLKYLAEQYQVREKQYEKMNEQVQLESQLHDAKLAKFQMEATIEKEILLREKQAILDELLNCKKAIQEMKSREESLKEQLNLYTSKYDDFQTSLQKSNDIFVTYKSEIEKMSKTIRKLEKESLEWKRKCEKSNATLLDFATENQARNEYIAKCTRQNEQLQKLLRTLQAERVLLHQVLKENNIERPSVPVLPPEPEPISMPPPVKPELDKMDIMAKNCAELKETLSKLQGQMNAITNKQSEKEPSELKKSRPKKTKNKSKVSSSKDLVSNLERNSKTDEPVPVSLNADDNKVNRFEEGNTSENQAADIIEVSVSNSSELSLEKEFTQEDPKLNIDENSGQNYNDVVESVIDAKMASIDLNDEPPKDSKVNIHENSEQNSNEVVECDDNVKTEPLNINHEALKDPKVNIVENNGQNSNETVGCDGKTKMDSLNLNTECIKPEIENNQNDVIELSTQSHETDPQLNASHIPNPPEGAIN